MSEPRWCRAAHAARRKWTKRAELIVLVAGNAVERGILEAR